MPAPRNESSRPVSTFRAASCSRWATSSGSDRAASSSSSRRKRTPSGTSRKSSSTDSTPIVASICSRSRSVSERKLTRRSLLGDEALVGLSVHEPVGLGWITEPDADEPPFAVGILVHGPGLVDGLLVDLDNRAREGRDQIGDGLDGLNLTVRRARGDLGALLRGLVVDELAQRVLGEPGDPERRLAVLEAGPVVL